jgi:hypothetical protein
MRRWTAAATAAALAVFAAGAPAAEDPAAALKGDVDALVKMLDDRWGGRDDGGPSPTARVNRLVAAGDAKLRPVLAEAWRVVTTSSDAERYRNPARQLVRFLYSLAATGGAAAQGDDEILEEDGIVRIRAGDAVGNFGWKGWNGGGFGRRTDESAPPFAEVVKGGKLRKASKPDVKKALAALDAGRIAENERYAAAKAIGEACATNKPALQDLLRRQDADPASPWLLTALAWTASPDAERPLRLEIESLAGRVAEGREAAAPILAAACRSLRRLRNDALVEEAAKLTGAPREALLAAAGLDFATALDVAAVEKAPDAAAKDAALAAACRRIVASHGDERASAATLTALVKLLAASAGAADEALRRAVLDAAEALLYAYNRYPIQSGSSTGDGASESRTTVTGERLGAYPDMASVLASMGKDLAKGDFVFTDERETLLFDMAGGTVRGETKALASDVRSPDSTSAPDERSAVRLKGEFVEGGLRLTITNAGAASVAVDPVALRYGTAELTRHEFAGGAGGGKPYRQLALFLGFVRAGVATPADRLVVLAPKAEFTWTAPVRPEHRDADHVSVECYGGFAVRGTPAAAPLGPFLETWVK